VRLHPDVREGKRIGVGLCVWVVGVGVVGSDVGNTNAPHATPRGSAGRGGFRHDALRPAQETVLGR
jgi:hypothetical protein